MRKNKKKKAKTNFSLNMIITNNNPYTRVESYPAKEPHDSMLNLVLMPSPSVNGVSVNTPSPHPKIDCHLTSDLFTVKRMLDNGIEQDVKTVSFDSESPEFVYGRISDIMSRLPSVPDSEPSDPAPDPVPEPAPDLWKSK